jgi:hypothetical protein
MEMCMDKHWGNFWKLAFAMLVIVGLVVACGELPQVMLRDSVQKISIQPLENKTTQTDMEQMLNEKVPQAFIVNGRLKVVNKEDADIVLQWTLQRYDKIVMLRDANQNPVLYRLQIIVDVDLIDGKSGKTLLTTRRTVDLTPEPTKLAGDQEGADWDSTEIRSLKEFTRYYTLNSLGKKPEDEYTAEQRVSDQMASRVIRLVVTGSFNAKQAPQAPQGPQGSSTTNTNLNLNTMP